MTIQNLVLEIGAEELPSRFIPDALSFLEKTAREDFSASRITFKNLSVFATPRRIALVFRDVDDLQKDLVTTFRGPAWKTAFDANGFPTRAAQGFAKGRGVPVENLTPVESDGVKYACATVSEKGKPSVEILPELLSSLIKKLTFPKSMFWDDSGVRFARPVRWILAMADGKTLTFPYGEITSGNITIGAPSVTFNITGIPGLEHLNSQATTVNVPPPKTEEYEDAEIVDDYEDEPAIKLLERW